MQYKQNLLKRMIILCWIFLLVCFIIKLFGGNIFQIAVDNERFIAFCNFIDNHLILKSILQFILYFISTYFYLCGACGIKTFTKKQFIIVFISFSLIFIAKTLFSIYINNLSWIMMIIETIICVMIPIIFGRKWYFSILFFALLNVFQLVSLFVKDLGIFKVIENNTLIALIYLIDYYLMIILFYLYCIYVKKYKKEEE